MHFKKMGLLAALVCVSSTCLAQQDSTQDMVNDTVNGVLDVSKNIQEDARPEFEILVNTVPSAMNQPVDNSAAKPLINNTAYHLEAALMYKSDKRDFFNFAQSTHAYFSLHLLQYVNSGYTNSYWADSTTSTAFVYGNKYYLQPDYQGLGYGWYAGLSLWKNKDAYYWYSSGGPVYTDVTDSGVAPIVAGEAFYKVQFNNIVIAPRLVLSMNKDFSEVLFMPQLMVGAHF